MTEADTGTLDELPLTQISDGTYATDPSASERQMMSARTPSSSSPRCEWRRWAAAGGGVRECIHNLGLAVWLRRDRRWRLAAYQPRPLPTD
jgi:hypothetical protein